MKHSRITIPILACTCLAACKANQEQYQSVYESAVAKREASTSVEETIYGKYRDMAFVQQLPIGTDTLAVITEYVSLTDDPGLPSRNDLQRYNVVVGRFKQIFNARQMRQRLADNGYLQPFLLQTREPLYYVVAHTVATPQQALDSVRAVKADTTLRLRDPLPLVIQPASFAR